MKLSDHLAKVEILLEKIDENEAWQKEIPQDVIEELTTVTGDLSNKVDNWVGFLRAIRAQEVAAEDDYKQAKSQRSKIATLAKSTKEYLKFVMVTFGKQKLEGLPKESGACSAISLVNNSQESLNLQVPTSEVTIYKVIDDSVMGFVSGLNEYVEERRYLTLNTDKLRYDLSLGKKLSWATLTKEKHIRFKV